MLSMLTKMIACFTAEKNSLVTPLLKIYPHFLAFRNTLIRAKTMSDDQYFHEASTSRCKKQLPQLKRASILNHMGAEKVSMNLFQEDSKQLEGRLKVLEEEAEMLKRALLASVEESKKLITEIHHHFNTIHCCLSQKEVDRGKLYSQIISLSKDRRAGLLQVLCQESNPSIVNKGLRTKALG